MTYEKNGYPDSQSNEQENLDLIDILLQIWRGKWLVGLFVLLSLVIAVVYLSVAKEKWTSVAVISSPDAGQIASYTNAISVLNNDDKYDIIDIQQRVIGRFNSAFSALAETLNNQEKPEKLTIDPAVQGQPLPLKLTYQGPTAREAQQKLAQYIEKVDQQIAKELIDDLNTSIKSRSADLVETLAAQEKVAQEQKDLRIKQIAQALSVAKEAEVQSPQVRQAQNVSQDTLFLLGSSALESMIKNESSRPLIFSDDYYKIRQNLLNIQSISVRSESVHGYRYVMKPTEPIRRDSPKLVLTLVLAVLLGIMIGSGYVLARNAIRAYQVKP
ncbi:chain length determination protein [Kosakonia radicincitans]|uniref:LPS O-antigen chain length determinant protein WzzB n=1 Tax=Kosakonia TaxID=1330547 RepID=UPI0009036696|nr:MULTISPECIES: LPS O-antigen chain length determinant protein WzzB [Kosakonia]APG21041.1 chain length determination protein [Kosakonia radicincitans]NCF05458.1 LPS O-antigen chain length determinant protein WzzB [Kosakonia sp. MH5]